MTETARTPDTTIATALTAISATITLAWAGAALAAAITGAPPPPFTTGALANAARTLPTHLGEPAAAWWPPNQPDTPGAFTYWTATAVAFAGAALAVRAFAAAVARVRGRHPLGALPNVGLARTRDLASLAVPQPTGDRVALGRHARRLIAAEPQASVAVIGPTGCGKTAGLAIPALLEWDGPVIATSIKGDLVERTLHHRETLGPVWVYDPTEHAAIADGWSPLPACRSWAGAQRVAAWLVAASQARRDTVTDGDYWYTQARKALAPHLYAAAHAEPDSGIGMHSIVRWFDLEVQGDARELIKAAESDDPFAEDAMAAARGLWQKEERLRSSVYATLQNVVAAYADPAVADLEADHTIDLDEWLNENGTLYVVAPSHDQSRLRPVLAVLVAEAIRRAFDTANANGGALQNPCLALLDEAANIAPQAELPNWVATARSHNITFLTVWQDLAQLRHLYGESAATVLNNHKAKIFASGLSDTATLEYLATLIGDTRTLDTSWSVDLATGRRNVSINPALRRLGPPDLLRRLPTNDALLLYANLAPARLQLRPWWTERNLAQLATPDPQ